MYTCVEMSEYNSPQSSHNRELPTTPVVEHGKVKRIVEQLSVSLSTLYMHLCTVTRYLVRVHKWSGWTNYVEHKWSPRTTYVVISGLIKT